MLVFQSTLYVLTEFAPFQLVTEYINKNILCDVIMLGMHSNKTDKNAESANQWSLERPYLLALFLTHPVEKPLLCLQMTG